MPLQGRLAFYGRYAGEILSKHWRFATMYREYRRIHARALRAAVVVTDVAMMPVSDDEFASLEMYTATPATRIAVEKLRRHKRAHAPSG